MTTSNAPHSVRLDHDSEVVLNDLVEQGMTKTEAFRAGLMALAREERSRVARAEAERLGSDATDLAEVRQVQAEMADLRAW